RPHRADDRTPIRPLEVFPRAVQFVLNAAPFPAGSRLPVATIRNADARLLPVKDASIDAVVTSPPYLNAIDYLRGHKFSLVWMGHSIESLRQLRAGNIGTEVASSGDPSSPLIEPCLRSMGRLYKLPLRQLRMLARYIEDMNRAVKEVARVLVP